MCFAHSFQLNCWRVRYYFQLYNLQLNLNHFHHRSSTFPQIQFILVIFNGNGEQTSTGPCYFILFRFRCQFQWRSCFGIFARALFKFCFFFRFNDTLSFISISSFLFCTLLFTLTNLSFEPFRLKWIVCKIYCISIWVCVSVCLSVSYKYSRTY